MSKICYIVGAGENYGLDFSVQDGDVVIAADGGYTALVQAGIKPDVAIGDFDSLGAAPEMDQVITLPTVKDVTDTWAAIDWALGKGYEEFHLYGCTGGRIEHTFANIQTAADLAQKGMRCLIFGENQIISALANGNRTFPSRYSGYLSVFAFTDICRNVTLQGLKYELENAELTNRFPLGVSNEFIGRSAVVSVGQGIAILVYDRKNLQVH